MYLKWNVIYSHFLISWFYYKPYHVSHLTKMFFTQTKTLSVWQQGVWLFSSDMGHYSDEGEIKINIPTSHF